MATKISATTLKKARMLANAYIQAKMGDAEAAGKLLIKACEGTDLDPVMDGIAQGLGFKETELDAACEMCGNDPCTCDEPDEEDAEDDAVTASSDDADENEEDDEDASELGDADEDDSEEEEEDEEDEHDEEEEPAEMKASVRVPASVARLARVSY